MVFDYLPGLVAALPTSLNLPTVAPQAANEHTHWTLVWTAKHYTENYQS